MKRQILAATAVLLMTAGIADAAPRKVQVGRLACDVEAGIGLILGSSKDMTCKFTRKGHKAEIYKGTINKVGLDIGITGQTHIEWLVFAAAETPLKGRALAGTYVGGSGEATIGVGLGANWLIGGSKKSFALQPWSVQAQTGLNASLALAGLTLR